MCSPHMRARWLTALSLCSLTGKLAAVDKLVKLVHKSTDDKIVIVSNFTSTLDILEDLCDRRGWSTLRLDGKTKQDTRQELVNDL